MGKRFVFYGMAGLNPAAFILAVFGSAGLVMVAAVGASQASAGASSLNGGSLTSPTAEPPPLKLVQTIRLTNIVANQPEVSADQLAKEVQSTRMVNVANHFDHFEVDLKRHRLFITPEDNKTVEVYDLQTGKLVHSIGGIGMAHGVLYRPDIDEVFVTDGTVGSLKIFTGGEYKLIKETKLLVDADSIGYDPKTHYLYIDNGGKDAGLDYSLVSIVNTDTGEHLGDIKVESNRVEAMKLENGGPRIFLNATEKNEVAVIDREKRAVVARWPVTGGTVNVGVAVDEVNHRLFIACRDGKLLVMDSDSGKVLQTLPIATGVDDVVYDPVSKRIYVACGEGFVNVYAQTDADHYAAIGKIATGPLGKTGKLVPELNRYFVAIPPHGKTSAEVLVFAVQ
jgi:DNA-binding beta-propeller fold protein YncE